MAKRGRIFRRTKKDPVTGERVEVGPYKIQIWLNGKDRKFSTHSTNREVAAKMLTKLLAAKDAGTLTEAMLKPLRFKDLQAAIELDYRLQERRSTDRMQDAFQALNSKFEGWKTSAITKQRLKEYVMERLEAGIAPATALYELRMLRRAFRLAEVPCPTFPSIEVNNVRKEFFEPHEFQAVVDRLPIYLRPVMKAGYLMGWRIQSELLPLEWKHIDFKLGIITIPIGSTKNGEGRTYPFGKFPELLTLFQARWKEREELQRARGIVIPWVFFRVTKAKVLPIKSYTTAWDNARVKVGLAHKWVHDFRRSGVRSLRQAGVPESVAQALTGHKTPSVFRRYDIVDAKDMSVGVEKLAAFHAHQSVLQDNYGTVTPLPVPTKKEQHG
ncbi:MAG: tyrosine-type recombinase/integrase [Nitrospiraceae bacterium]